MYIVRLIFFFIHIVENCLEEAWQLLHIISASNIWTSSPFRSLDVVQIFDVQDHLLGLLLGCLSLLLCQLQVSPNDILQRFDIHLKAKTSITLWLQKTLVSRTTWCVQTSQVSPHAPAGRCSCTGKDPPWPGGSCGDPRRAPGTWAWWARGSSAMFDVSCSWWHRTKHPRLAASCQPQGTLHHQDEKLTSVSSSQVNVDRIQTPQNFSTNPAAH